MKQVNVPLKPSLMCDSWFPHTHQLTHHLLGWWSYLKLKMVVASSTLAALKALSPSLIDGGANGGMSGCDVCILQQTPSLANGLGISDKSDHSALLLV
jgi:hypothetical protein